MQIFGKYTAFFQISRSFSKFSLKNLRFRHKIAYYIIKIPIFAPKYETTVKQYCLVMFNRVAQREFATAHNITGNMSRSRKRFPAGTCCCCKSQKRGKQISHRKFRRLEHVLMHNYHFEKLPMLQYELTRQWDLGGDGKCFWGWTPDEGWFKKEMRK